MLLTKQSPTRKEHYIPQVYLNGFASSDKRIYFFDLNTLKYSDCMVPVKDICYKKDLYEYKNKNDDIIYTNTIEKALSVLERMFSKHRESMRSRIKLTDPHTKNFLSDEEGVFWITYITVQLLRMPKVINEISSALEEMIPSNGDSNLHRNTALFLLLPFLRQLEPESIEARLYGEIFDSISKMKCTVAYDSQHRLFTSDCPLYLYAPTQKISDCRKIVFPIDSSLCIIFTTEELYPDNGIISINDYELESIFKSIAYASDEKIYTATRFTKQELVWIKSALNDKKTDRLSLL